MFSSLYIHVEKETNLTRLVDFGPLWNFSMTGRPDFNNTFMEEHTMKTNLQSAGAKIAMVCIILIAGLIIEVSACTWFDSRNDRAIRLLVER